MNLFSPQWTLLAGILISLFIQGNAFQAKAKLWSTRFLQLSVVLLGASLNFNSVLTQGLHGFLITFLSILFVFVLGYGGAKLLKINKDQGNLITIGTAICGGSAIGALSPIIRADNLAITVSIGVIFLLNALGVFIFPVLGDIAGLTQEEFGLWAALAIHDTSSVVAASAIYGERALAVATTVKLMRALWIMPIALLFSYFSRGAHREKIPLPWFIIGFITLSMIFTFIDLPGNLKGIITNTAKGGFSITLLLIGLSFDMKKLRDVGMKPLIFGMGLWIIVSIVSLLAIQIF